jgi:glyoxylase-like metal-dependent hydrolase (beta-lactamase superfamily II)
VYVLNTHIHDDHVGGNKAFGVETTIIAHDNVRGGLVAGKHLPKWPLAKEHWPILTFNHTLTLNLNGEEVKVIHYPGGHTDGDSVVYFSKANVVQMGDLYFNGFLPIVDLEGGGNFFRYLSVVESIYVQVRDDTRIVPGHGPLATKKDLGTYVRLLHETRDLVMRKVKRGDDLSQIQKEGLQKEWASWQG